MCFNQKTSLAAFSVSFVCFVYLLYYGITRKNNYDIFAAIFTLLHLFSFKIPILYENNKNNSSRFLFLI